MAWPHLLNLGVLLAAGYFGYVECVGYVAEPTRPQPLASQTVGPWRAVLMGENLPRLSGQEATFRLDLDCPACGDAIRAARIALPDCHGLTAHFSGPPIRRVATLSLPAECTAPRSAVVTVLGWDGAMHQAIWPLSTTPEADPHDGDVNPSRPNH